MLKFRQKVYLMILQFNKVTAFFASNTQTAILNAITVTFLDDRQGIVAHVGNIVEEIIVVIEKQIFCQIGSKAQNILPAIRPFARRKCSKSHCLLLFRLGSSRNYGDRTKIEISKFLEQIFALVKVWPSSKQS